MTEGLRSQQPASGNINLRPSGFRTRRRKPVWAVQRTTSVPSIPAARWPGTLQKNVYVPGFRVKTRFFVPPWNVAVAPRTEPLVPCWTVRLCCSPDAFVNLIVTFPAFAVNDVLVNPNWPLGSAASDCELLPCPVAALADVVAVAAEDVADALDVDAPAVPLLVPPHPPSAAASPTVTSTTAGNFNIQGPRSRITRSGRNACGSFEKEVNGRCTK